ncbi:secreted RxLR effector protein 161-like [Aristolochia californica]|uniref:secreted RxLR effector protein 161-like n=1 Tax=Aristolochia californica TaxID=171875 RepID=UPI0035DEC3EA
MDSPIELNHRLGPTDGDLLFDVTRYREVVGSLVYLTVTRPDITYVVHVASQFASAPRTTHWTVVLRILRYLCGTVHHGLLLSSTSDLVLTGYSDADWAGDPTDRKSTTGYCIFLGNSLVAWKSKKQSVVSRSSVEAEYRAMASITAELIWFRRLLEELGFPQLSATPMFCDNQSAIQIAKNPVFHERTKHIEIDCHFVRHHYLQGSLTLPHVSSTSQLADLFTKSHTAPHFHHLISKLMVLAPS